VGRTLFRNASVLFDGRSALEPGYMVLLEADLISFVTRETIDDAGLVIDLNGMTLMPVKWRNQDKRRRRTPFLDVTTGLMLGAGATRVRHRAPEL
jgi:hypothetical protein